MWLGVARLDHGIVHPRLSFLKNKFQLPRRRGELISHLRLYSSPPFPFMAVHYPLLLLLPGLLLHPGPGSGGETNVIFAH